MTSFLITHSGGFHADELLSSVILKRLFPEARIVRSRASEWIEPAPDRIVYDVGGIYDPERGMFDHHQRGAPLRADGHPYSSFGLIWKHFGTDYLRSMGLPEAHIARIHAEFDARFVMQIDQLDNGTIEPSVAGPLSGHTLPELLELLKPTFDNTDPDADTRAFHTAREIAQAFVEARVTRLAAKLRAESMVNAAIREAGQARVLELPMGMPFQPAVAKADADHLLFVVHPRQDDWSLTGIRRFHDSFELRADLPKAWAGLTGAELEQASGVKGAKFCHNKRFLAVAATREAILAMADLAVNEAETA